MSLEGRRSAEVGEQAARRIRDARYFSGLLRPNAISESPIVVRRSWCYEIDYRALERS